MTRTISVPKPRRRAGLSLMEVLVSMAIFLLSLVALGRLVTMGADQALEVRFESEAAQICQSKLAEVSGGAIPLTSQPRTSLDEDPDWEWDIDCQQGVVAGLWIVRVRASRMTPAGDSREYCTLTQMVLDPAQRGSTQDTTTIAGSDAASSGGAAGGTGSTSGAASGGAAAGAGAQQQGGANR
jgi:type II secretory pathway pseudopilin PulG